MIESNGTTDGTASKLVEKPKDTYLGPCCPVCHVPIACHPVPRRDSGCYSHVPTWLFGSAHWTSISNLPDMSYPDCVAIDAAEIAEARERYRQSVAERLEAEAKGRSMPLRIPGSAGPTWSVLVRVPGDPSGEPADTGEVVMAKTEEEALAKAGTRCNTGRVSVRRLDALGCPVAPPAATPTILAVSLPPDPSRALQGQRMPSSAPGLPQDRSPGGGAGAGRGIGGATP